MRSPWGRVLKGIREDEDAVRSLGKNVYAYKMQSLIIGGVFGGLAGIMSALAALGDQPVVLRDRHHLLRLHRAAASVAPPGCSARSPARSIFWFLISFLDLFFGQATAGVTRSSPTTS